MLTVNFTAHLHALQVTQQFAQELSTNLTANVQLARSIKPIWWQSNGSGRGRGRGRGHSRRHNEQ
jgi:hypothetical protein